MISIFFKILNWKHKAITGSRHTHCSVPSGQLKDAAHVTAHPNLVTKRPIARKMLQKCHAARAPRHWFSIRVLPSVRCIPVKTNRLIDKSQALAQSPPRGRR
jgi:hypothetical protein